MIHISPESSKKLLMILFINIRTELLMILFFNIHNVFCFISFPREFAIFHPRGVIFICNFQWKPFALNSLLLVYSKEVQKYNCLCWQQNRGRWLNEIIKRNSSFKTYFQRIKKINWDKQGATRWQKKVISIMQGKQNILSVSFFFNFQINLLNIHKNIFVLFLSSNFLLVSCDNNSRKGSWEFITYSVLMM